MRGFQTLARELAVPLLPRSCAASQRHPVQHRGWLIREFRHYQCTICDENGLRKDTTKQVIRNKSVASNVPILVEPINLTSGPRTKLFAFKEIIPVAVLIKKILNMRKI